MRKVSKEQAVAEYLLQTKATFGEGVVYRLGEQPLPRNVVSTGIPELDAIIGGGLVMGRINEIWGLPSAGKTMSCYQFMHGFDLSMFIDAEGTLDEEMAKQYGASTEKTLVMKPDYAEQALWAMIMAMRDKDLEVGCFVIDSVPTLIPHAELERMQAKNLKEFMKSDAIATLARILSKKLTYIAHLATERQASVILINQMRNKMGVMFPGQELYDTPGGNALHHIVSVRIKFSRIEWIKDEKLGKIGQKMRAVVGKSKVCKPQGEAELCLIFERGFVPHAQLDSVINEMRIAAGGKAKRVMKKQEELDAIEREQDEEEAAIEKSGIMDLVTGASEEMVA
jgi:protein RecA